MALLSEDIVGAFPSWAKSQPQYADLDLENVVVVTVPQPIVVQMIRTEGIALGNLTLDVSRKSGFYPDIVMGGPNPLRQVRKLGVIEPQARFFAKNRGLALLVRKGNPLGIHGLTDVARTGARIALPEAVDEAGSSRQVPNCRRRTDRKAGRRRPSSRRRYRTFPVASALSSRFSRDGGPRLRGRSPHAVSPYFLLDADIPRPLRTRADFGRRAIFCKDLLRPRN